MTCTFKSKNLHQLDSRIFPYNNIEMQIEVMFALSLPENYN